MENDLRVVKTKEAIEKNFLELLEVHGYENIHLVDIAKKARINRNTIYLHYDSKQEIIESIVKNTFKEQMDKLQINEYMKMRNNRRKIHVMFETILNVIEEEIDLYRLILTESSLSGYVEKLILDIKKYIKQIVKETPKNELIINYLLFGIYGFIRNWIVYATGTKEENVNILTDLAIASSRQLQLR